KVVAVLLEYPTQIGQPLALFAAAETARDQLGAPALARSLFVAYADVAPSAVWAPKALLAAIAVDPGSPEADRLRRRLDAHAGNVYLAAIGGSNGGAQYELAENRLSGTLSTLRQRARTDADRRDALLVQALAALDSARAQTRADSLEAGCSGFLDSLRIAGIRADSVRAACMRGDSLHMDSLLTVDTLLLVPDSAAADSLRRDTL